MNLIVASMPMMLIPDEDDVEHGHQNGRLFHQAIPVSDPSAANVPPISKKPTMICCINRPIAPTTTAGVITYSMFSASPW